MSNESVTIERGSSPEELLAPLLRGDFVLTDAKGAITRWGASPSKLFGWRAEEVIGRSAFDTLLASGGSKWRRRLEAGEGEYPGPAVEADAKHSEGREFPMELLFLPVLLSESLDFSRLLEIVAADLSDESKLSRLKRDHSPAFEAVAGAATGTRQTPEDARLAGMVLTFRPLVETPWTDEPEETEPDPGPLPPASPAVGPTEEILVRVGEIERASQDAGAAIAEQVSELRAAFEQRLDEALKEAAAARAVAEQALALADESQRDAERQRRELAEAERSASPTEPADDAEAPGRASRDGFDDADVPMAVIGLDGHFELLNSGFEALVGYPEAEFRRARWPSAVDRDNLVAHRELLAGFASGELDEARVDTIYVHGQGLLVPIAGQLELTRDADGSPAGILLSVEA